MKKDIICAGFGGQGVLTIGKFIAQAAMQEGKCVSWLPSYGPEMRGGTANVSVVVSDTDIASPIVSQSDILVALNQPSLDKFGPKVRPGGVIIINSGMCPHGIKRDDVNKIIAPMSEISKELGSLRVLNMLAIGVVIGATELVMYETIEEDLKEFLKVKNPDLLEQSLDAVKRGINIGRS